MHFLVKFWFEKRLLAKEISDEKIVYINRIFFAASPAAAC